MQTDITASTASHPRRLSFDALALWVLTVTAALAAVLFVPVANIPFIHSKVAVLALGGLGAMALYILARLTRGNIIIPPLALVGSFWILPLAYGLSSILSGDGVMMGVFGTAFETDTFGFMVLAALFATLAALAFRRSSQYRTFYQAGMIALAVALVAQVFFIVIGNVSDTIAPTANVVGSFADLGMFAGLGIATILIAFRFLNPVGRFSQALWALEAGALVVLMLVNSRAVWIMVGLVALGLFIEGIMRRQGAAQLDDDLDGIEVDAGPAPRSGAAIDMHTLAAPLVTLAFALFFLIGGNTIGASLANTVGVNYLDVRPSWQATFDVGSHTYASSPLFGSGPGTFGEEWLKFKDRALNETPFWNVDFVSGIGFIPTSFVTTGIVGALAWIGFLGLFLYIGIRSLLFRAPEERFARFVAVSSFVGTLYVFMLALFAVPGPVVLLSGFLLAGLFASSLRYGGSRREMGIVFSRNPRIGFLIVFALTLMLLVAVVTAYLVVERYLADVSFQRATAALAAGDLETAGVHANQSRVFAETDRAYQVIAAAGIAQMNRIAADTTLSPSQAQQQFQGALSTSIQAAARATELRPDNYQNWVVLGNVYQTVVPLRIEGAYENAKQAYARAMELNPTNPVLPLSTAQLEIAQGDGAAAEAELTKSISLKRDFTQAIFLLSQLEVQLGKAREALEAAEAAAYFAPDDPVVLFQVGILRYGTGNTPGAIQALERAVEVNPQYANARFFLAAALASTGQFTQAASQLEAIAALSPENAAAVSENLAALRAGRNPFPAAAQGTLGLPPPVSEAQPAVQQQIRR